MTHHEQIEAAQHMLDDDLYGNPFGLTAEEFVEIFAIPERYRRYRPQRTPTQENAPQWEERHA